jgi:hypothetical protein
LLVPTVIAGLQTLCGHVARFLFGYLVVGDKNTLALASVAGIQQIDGIEGGCATREEINDQGVRLVLNEQP